MTWIINFLRCPIAVLSLIVLVSAFSLAAAFIAELIFNLEPCILCIYQRYPFAIAIALGILGLLLKKNRTAIRAILALCSLSFLINAVIAFYHTGVELHWWVSAVEGCIVNPFTGNEQTILENLLSTPSAHCDEIPWADPILGLSMANYNVLLCLGLAGISAISIFQIKPQQKSE